MRSLLDATNRAEDAAFRRFSAYIFREFEMTKPSSPKATVRRYCCASTMFLDEGALPLSRLLKEQKSGFPRHMCCVRKSGFFNTEVPRPVCMHGCCEIPALPRP